MSMNNNLKLDSSAIENELIKMTTQSNASKSNSHAAAESNSV